MLATCLRRSNLELSVTMMRTAEDCRVEELKKAMRANPSIDTAPIVGLVVLNEGMVD